MNSELSRRQNDIVDILGVCARQGWAPVVAEIAAELGLKGESSVTPHLDALKRKGFVRVEGGVRGRQRQILLTEKGQFAVGLSAPILGCIPAGPPTEVLPAAFEDAPESLGGTLAGVLKLKPGDFFLKVQGESMIGDGICDGDLVLIRPDVQANNGEIAAVAVGEERCATLKWVFWKPETDEVELRPSNPDLKSLCVPVGEVHLTGVFRGLVRCG